MDKLQKFINAEVLKECLRGTPLDLGVLPEDKHRICAILMVHCCLNGPVGVNKETTFPEDLRGSIKGLLGLNVSNNSWTRTCIPFARFLAQNYPREVEACQQVKIHQVPWPLWDVNRT